MIERAGQDCAIETALFERISQPYAREGQRTGALRFGDPRVMALAGALGVMVHAVSGFTNKSLRSLVAGLLGADYTANQMTYDLRRLRLHGLIERLPHTKHLRHHARGLRAALFYTRSTTESSVRCSARPTTRTSGAPSRHRDHRPRPSRTTSPARA